MFFVVTATSNFAEKWLGVVMADGPQHAKHIAESRFPLHYRIEVSPRLPSRINAEEYLRGLVNHD